MNGLALAAAVSVVALGGGYLALAVRVPAGSIEQPGPGFFPVAVGLLVLAAGAGYAAEVVRGRGAVVVERPAPRRVLVMAAALAAFCLALPLAGYVPSLVAPLLVALRLFGLRRSAVAVGLALLLAVASWWVFGVLLGVPLPRGRWVP